MLKYFNSIKDDNGCVHSIDNVVITYYLRGSVELMVDQIRTLREMSDNYWERTGMKACQKYSWYQNQIHLDDGIFVSLGRYSDYDKQQKKFFVYPLMKVEVNPNKHYDKLIFHSLLKLVKEWTAGGYMNKYDYAIDIPVNPDRVKVFGSRKEPGLHKGTRYWGQRNKHGYLKIYDKKKESQLDTPLTRVEHTWFNNEKVSYEDVYIIQYGDLSADLSQLDTVNRALVEMINLLKLHDEDYEHCIKDLNYRRIKKIEPFIVGSSEKLEYNEIIHKSLLDRIYEVFELTDIDDVNVQLYNAISADDEGFVSISDINVDDLMFV